MIINWIECLLQIGENPPQKHALVHVSLNSIYVWILFYLTLCILWSLKFPEADVLHSRRWSGSRETAMIRNIPIGDRSSFNNIIKIQVITQSKICPWMCLGDLKCWMRKIDSNKSTNLAVSTSPLTSRWKLKLADIQSGTLDINNESTILVTNR